MRVAMIGATGVIGRAAVPALRDAGHEVVALARTPEKARLVEAWGARAVLTRIGDDAGLGRLLAEADAVCNFATAIPVGFAALRPGAWRANDLLRTEGARRVAQAAREAGVRRVVQESVSFLYADHGDRWVTEQSTLGITRATEPVTVAESHVQDFSCGSRTGVALRLGLIVGDDPMTRWQLRAAERGRPVGLGRPDGFMHVVHTADLGAAVVAALHAPSGVYNVGAEPVRRADYVQAFAEATGRASGFVGPVLARLAGVRAEPLSRSLRVSSEHFTASTGWAPSRPVFDASWLPTALTRSGAAG